MTWTVWKRGLHAVLLMAFCLGFGRLARTDDGPMKVDIVVRPVDIDANSARVVVDCRTSNLPRNARVVLRAARVYPTLNFGSRKFDIHYSKFKMPTLREDREREVTLRVSGLGVCPPGEYKIRLELDPSQLPMVDAGQLQQVSPREAESVVFLGSPLEAVRGILVQMENTIPALYEMLELYDQIAPAEMSLQGDIVGLLGRGNANGLPSDFVLEEDYSWAEATAQAVDEKAAPEENPAEPGPEGDTDDKPEYKYSFQEGIPMLYRHATSYLPVESQIMPGCANFIANMGLYMISSKSPRPSNQIKEYPRYVATCEIGVVRTALEELLYFMKIGRQRLDDSAGGMFDANDAERILNWNTGAALLEEAAGDCWSRCRDGYLTDKEYLKALKERLAVGTLEPVQMEQLEVENTEFHRRVSHEKLIEGFDAWLAAWAQWREATVQRAQFGPDEGREADRKKSIQALEEAQVAVEKLLRVR